jgi:hypothetical protein
VTQGETGPVWQENGPIKVFPETPYEIIVGELVGDSNRVEDFDGDKDRKKKRRGDVYKKPGQRASFNPHLLILPNFTKIMRRDASE